MIKVGLLTKMAGNYKKLNNMGKCVEASVNGSQEPGHSAVSASLSSLTAAATHFETECRMLILRFLSWVSSFNSPHSFRSQKEPLNQNFVTQQVIQCAFDIAKATKQLVALFQ